MGSSISERKIKEEFERFGDVIDYSLKRKSGKSTNYFGYVVMKNRADAEEAKNLYGMEFVDMATIKDCDAVILAVAHDEFNTLTPADFDKMFKAGANDTKVLADIKGILTRRDYEALGYRYWRL